MAAVSPFFRPTRSANHHENRANEQKHGGYARDLDSFITAAVPHVAREGPLRPPQDTLRVIASYPAGPKRKRGWRRRACDNANLRYGLGSSLFVGGALCDAVSLFRFFFYCLTNSTPFPDRGPKHVFFFEIKLKFIEIEFLLPNSVPR